jgi:hypothetical protein
MSRGPDSDAAVMGSNPASNHTKANPVRPCWVSTVSWTNLWGVVEVQKHILKSRKIVIYS